MISLEEGDNCPIAECEGKLEYVHQEGQCICSNSNAPCYRCTDAELTCTDCYTTLYELLTLIKEENEMEISKNILRVFTVSYEAAVVAEYLGAEYGDDHRDYLDLFVNKEAVLAEAKRLKTLDIKK